jgi:inner membrane protein
LDPLTQGTLGAALSQSAASRERIRAFAVAGALAGLAPDLDILIRSSTDPLLYLEYHRQFSHSLLFIPIGAGLVAFAAWPLLRRRLSVGGICLACLLGYASHGLLDACTSYGTQLFWPFSDVRIAWNWISVVDPLFSLPLLVLVLLAASTRRRAFALAGLCWAVAYLSLGALQHQRATAITEALAAERGHQPSRITVKPGFANLLVWKSLYEADGYLYVDGIRAAPTGAVCEGDRIRRFNLRRDLPWLDTDSQQAKDLARFAWYSDHWLAIDPAEPNYVVDVRYAALPNRIEALWGLKVDRTAAAESHAAWHVVPSRRSDDLDGLLELLAGKGCRTMP